MKPFGADETSLGGLELQAQAGERAVLVHVDLKDAQAQEALPEFRALVRSAGAEGVATVEGVRPRPDAALFVGRGKAEEIRDRVHDQSAGVVLFNHDLSPAQERNLENLLGCRVVDRTRLILDIFAQRARSFEGKLQVELAQLQHLSTRLVRGWTHLERQKGGIGLRGPGESQLETDRRLIGNRIKQITRRLVRLRSQREQGRKARRRAELPTVSLVGYTNAGKSTLFNRLTGAHAAAADLLFATLDPSLRRLDLPGLPAVILADTVGFIRHLPHDLVEAFRSTLQEASESSLLLHVVDASHPERDDCVAQVEEVLSAIGADAVPRLEVYNKVDRVDGSVPRVEREPGGRVRRVWISAGTGDGIRLLLGAIREHFEQEMVSRSLCLPPQAGRLRARLFELGAVRTDRVNEQGGWDLQVELRRCHLDQLRKQPEFRAHLPL